MDKLKALTGYNFLSALAISMQADLEDKVNYQPI
jgi:hypothetical protein